MPRKRNVGRPKKAKSMSRKRKVGRPKKAKRKRRKSSKGRGQQGDGFFDDLWTGVKGVVGGVKNSGVVGNALLATGNPLAGVLAKTVGFGQKGSGKRKLTKKQIAVLASDPRMGGAGFFTDLAKKAGQQAIQIAKEKKLVSNALASRGHGNLAGLARVGGFGQSGGELGQRSSYAFPEM